jgi:nitrogen regulatory protein PII
VVHMTRPWVVHIRADVDILHVDDAVRIRTGERGEAAI